MSSHSNGVAPSDATQVNYLSAPNTFSSWAFTLDHKRIGVMYLVGILSSFFLGGVFALLIRLQLIYPEGLFDPGIYNQIFTLHGAIMVFLFIVPSIPAGLGNFFLPIMLGAKDVAFPRMNLASFYLWIVGAMFFVVSLLSTGLDTGWTFYHTLQLRNQHAAGDLRNARGLYPRV